MTDQIRIPKPLPSDIEVADYVIRVHNSMAGGFECSECHEMDTCWPEQTDWFKQDSDNYRIQQQIVCENCGKSHMVAWKQTFKREGKK